MYIYCITHLAFGSVKPFLDVLWPDEVVVCGGLEDGVQHGDGARVRTRAHAALYLTLGIQKGYRLYPYRDHVE